MPEIVSARLNMFRVRPSGNKAAKRTGDNLVGRAAGLPWWRAWIRPRRGDSRSTNTWGSPRASSGRAPAADSARRWCSRIRHTRGRRHCRCRCRPTCRHRSTPAAEPERADAAAEEEDEQLDTGGSMSEVRQQEAGVVADDAAVDLIA